MNLIVAMTDEYVIGLENKLLWHIPDELKQFKKLTMNQTVVMGKNTLLSILDMLGEPLPSRRNLVLSNTLKFISGCEVINDWQVDYYIPQDSWVIGGQSIYTKFLECDLIDVAYVSHIKREVDGNKYFPYEFIRNWNKQIYNEHKDFTTYIYRKD